MSAIRGITLLVILGGAAANATAQEVIINGVRLEQKARDSLERAYGARIPPARYWYDRVSGAWGLEGGPTQGQVQAGMQVGGPLRADASKGNTGVFVNGRQLHPLDVAALRRCTWVIPGRYWVLPNGVGGYEGLPATFNLAVLCSNAASAAGGGSSTRCDNYGGGQFNCSNPRTGIGMISEGGGRGAVFVGGKVIMTPN